MPRRCRLRPVPCARDCATRPTACHLPSAVCCLGSSWVTRRGCRPGSPRHFRTAGLTHLVAVSGANLAIVTGFVLLLGRAVGLRGRTRIAVAALAMLGFVVLARPQPSVLRAAVMGGVALAALASGRRRRSLAALSATVVVLVLVDPWLARSFGFVLSVLATGALVTLAPGWVRRWRAAGLPSVAAHALAVPLAAQLVCGPVVVLLSEQVSLVAVPANILVAPAVAPATVLGVLATLASAVHPAVAVALAWLAGAFVWWIVRVATWSAALPSAAVGWPGSAGGAVVLAVATVAGVLLAPRLARHRLVAASVAVAVAALVVVPARSPGWPPPDWVLAVCDVGQGDALALSAGPGTAVVVDAGPDAVAVDRCLRRLGVDRVPLVRPHPSARRPRGGAAGRAARPGGRRGGGGAAGGACRRAGPGASAGRPRRGSR